MGVILGWPKTCNLDESERAPTPKWLATNVMMLQAGIPLVGINTWALGIPPHIPPHSTAPPGKVASSLTEAYPPKVTTWLAANLALAVHSSTLFG